MNVSKKVFLNVLVVAGMLVLNPPSSHAIIGISGAEGLGSFAGTLEYLYTDADNASLEIFLTNTSPVSNGGYITAIAFLNPDEFISGVSLKTASGLDTLLGALTFNNTVNAVPYGGYDIGAGVDSSWLGGGSPVTGIGVGDTESLLFGFTGSGLNGLTDRSFENLVVRLKGFDDGGSAKVPNDECDGDCDPQQPVIPEPATMVLLGGGLLGIFAGRRNHS